MPRAVPSEVAAASWRQVCGCHLRRCGIISLLYVWSYFVTMSLVAPIQKAFFPGLVMSLLFLPHGVRVLSAWLYGWRSALYLLPSAMLCNLHLVGDRAYAPDVILATLCSLIAAPLVISAIQRLLGPEVLAIGRTRVQSILALGLAASVVNLTTLRLILGLRPVEGVVIFLGDASGLIAALLILWAALHLTGLGSTRG